MRAIDWARAHSQRNPSKIHFYCWENAYSLALNRARAAGEEQRRRSLLPAVFIDFISRAMHNSCGGTPQCEREQRGSEKERASAVRRAGGRAALFCPCHLASPTAHEPRTQRRLRPPRLKHSVMIFRRNRPLEILKSTCRRVAFCFERSQFWESAGWFSSGDTPAKLIRVRCRRAGILIEVNKFVE